MAFKKNVPFLSPLQNSLLWECRYLLALSPCGNRDSLAQQENPDNQQDKDGFPSSPERAKPSQS
jgi:hypothetical protein